MYVCIDEFSAIAPPPRFMYTTENNTVRLGERGKEEEKVFSPICRL